MQHALALIQNIWLCSLLSTMVTDETGCPISASFYVRGTSPTLFPSFLAQSAYLEASAAEHLALLGWVHSRRLFNDVVVTSEFP